LSKVTVSAGICGFTAIIKARKAGKRKVKVKISCPCDMVKNLDKDLEGEISRDVLVRICDSEIYRLATKHIKHTACPVPTAVLKAIEVELGLALPKDVRMKVKK
jgi:cell wall assembly regulator SMI1